MHVYSFPWIVQTDKAFQIICKYVPDQFELRVRFQNYHTKYEFRIFRQNSHQSHIASLKKIRLKLNFLLIINRKLGFSLIFFFFYFFFFFIIIIIIIYNFSLLSFFDLRQWITNVGIQ